MVVVNKGNVGDGNIVHKAIVSYTSLVDKALIDNVGETRDMDMLVVDNIVNSNLADNGDVNTIKQHELCMEELMWKLKGNGSGLTDPFTIVQKSCERFSIYDEETHWKLKKPKLGDKFVNAEQFRECLTFYALANDFSLWCYGKILKTENSFQDHYRLLRSYGKALHESNKGSTVKIGVIVNPDAKTYFDRFYCDRNVTQTNTQVAGVHEPRHEANQGTKVKLTKSATIYRRRTTNATSPDPQPSQQRRAQVPFVQPRAKSQRILNEKLFARGSFNDNEIVVE
ncbi:hypothetical protein Tco_0998872 [Tanacetum coccineum]